MAQSNQAEVEGASTSTVVSALILNGVIFAVMITGFFLLRPKFRKIYQPKSYLGPKDERVETQPPGLFNWIPQWWSIPTIEIMHKVRDGKATISIDVQLDLSDFPLPLSMFPEWFRRVHVH